MALRLRLCAAKFAMPRILHEKYLAILQNKSVLIYKQWSPVRLWDLVQSTNVSVVDRSRNFRGPSETSVDGHETFVDGPQTFVDGPQTFVDGHRHS